MQRARLNRVHKVTTEMPAPTKPVILTNAKNNIQLNAMLVEGPLNSDYYTNAIQKHTLTTAVVVVSDVPVDIVGGVRIDQHDLCSTYEEADIILTQRAISCSLSGKCVRIVCDDTDVLVLLAHFYHIKCRGRNSAPIIMSSLLKERAVIDIGGTAPAQRHSRGSSGNSWDLRSRYCSFIAWRRQGNCYQHCQEGNILPF
ncbi:hypothetical protein NP493_230g00030 [Ridgeia piscesae]|uniref:Uncharacterized protein n=1 Tax=Ridgeia piscesae TaxID=27915 RepID=A0AAD9P079_RIDPI|nr:hypothetical protein NP493_230g00030 [Ridgeia piscesae]